MELFPSAIARGEDNWYYRITAQCSCIFSSNTKKASVDYEGDLVKISCFFLFPFWHSWWFFSCFFLLLFVIFMLYLSHRLIGRSIYRHVSIPNDKKFDIIILKEGAAIFSIFSACILNIVHSTLYSNPRLYFGALLRNEHLCWIDLSVCMCVCTAYTQSVWRWMEILQLTFRGNRVINLNFIFLVIFSLPSLYLFSTLFRREYATFSPRFVFF